MGASAVQVINMEWGNFDSELLPRCFADKELDTESLNQGEQVTTNLLCSTFPSANIVRSLLLPTPVPIGCGPPVQSGLPSHTLVRRVGADFREDDIRPVPGRHCAEDPVEAGCRSKPVWSGGATKTDNGRKLAVSLLPPKSFSSTHLLTYSSIHLLIYSSTHPLIYSSVNSQISPSPRPQKQSLLDASTAGGRNVRRGEVTCSEL